MKFLRNQLKPPHQTTLLLVVVAFLFGCGAVLAYDAPNFDHEIFSPDGLFLEDNDRDSLLAALAAVASNFPDNNKIDSDLKEKALALSLRIAPLHQNSRKAHAALMENRIPESTGFFDSITTVSETLWKIGVKLLQGGKPEPEAAKLALFLLDLSIITHPNPPQKRIEQFAGLTNYKLLPWEKFVTLQPKISVSSGKIGMLFSLLKMGGQGKKPGAASGSGSGPLNPFSEPPPGSADNNTERMRPPAPGGRPDPDIPVSVPKLTSTSVSVVASVKGQVQGIFSGILKLNILPASEEQKQRYGQRRGEDGSVVMRNFEMRLVTNVTNGPRIADFGQIFRLTRPKFPRWPDNSIARFAFTPLEPNAELKGPESVAETSLGGILLMHSIFTGNPLDPDLAFAARLERGTEDFSPKLINPDKPASFLKAARLLKKPFLVVPGSIFNVLLDETVSSGKLENLFQPQLFGASDLDDAIKLAFEDGEHSEAREKARNSFDEIKAVSGKMPLDELARNKKVQERLQQIVDIYPRHLSARLMLAFGEKTGKEAGGDAQEGGGMDVKKSVDQVDQVIGPYVPLGGDDAEYIDHNPLRQEIDQADRKLTLLRNGVVQKARSYVSRAEDLLEGAERYLSLTNKSTSIGKQRLREVRELVGELNRERVKLGLPALSTDRRRE